jgi:hypothetical protein
VNAADTPAEDREAPDVPARVSIPELQQRVLALAEVARAQAPEDAAEVDATERARAEARGYLYQLGFEDAALAPTWGRIPDEFRARLQAYTRGLQEYVDAGQGVYLGGQTGAGKTCALGLIALAAHRADLSCAYVLCGADLVWACDQRDRMATSRASRFDFDESFDPDAKPWPYMDMRLLLLDDLDLLRGTGYDPERDGWDTVGRFLYARMARGLATCIASNLPFADVGTGSTALAGLTSKPGLARVASRWEQRMPVVLRLMTDRKDQREGGQP